MTTLQVQLHNQIFTDLNTCPNNLQKTLKKNEIYLYEAIYIFTRKL